MAKVKAAIEELERERQGYTMHNKQNGVTIQCTQDYVEPWKQRGFEIIERGLIRLIDNER